MKFINFELEFARIILEHGVTRVYKCRSRQFKCYNSVKSNKTNFHKMRISTPVTGCDKNKVGVASFCLILLFRTLIEENENSDGIPFNRHSEMNTLNLTSVYFKMILCTNKCNAGHPFKWPRHWSFYHSLLLLHIHSWNDMIAIISVK